MRSYITRSIINWISEFGKTNKEEFWPKDIELLVYCDGYPLPDDIPKADNIKYFDLLENDNLLEFKEIGEETQIT